MATLSLETFTPKLYNDTSQRGFIMYDYELLNKLIDYNEVTGELKWKLRSGTRGSNRFNTMYAGNIATHKDRNGYLGLSIGGDWYIAHRVAWVIHHGSIDGKLQIDHINHKRDDNRVDNMRLVTRGENSKNRLPNKNTEYCVGVTYRKDRYVFTVKISVDKKVYRLGNYKSLFDAACARKSAEIFYGFDPSHGK